MRLKLFKLITILLLAGSSESRPQNFALEGGRPEVDVNEWKPVEMRNEGGSHIFLSNSRLRTSDSQRKLKDLQYMDQSLRTVATQLLNVTNPGDVIQNDKKPEAGDVLTKLIFVDTTTKDFEESQDASTVVEIMDPLTFDHNSTKSLPYERPVNSKFGYIESSHPGQAMAMTEEELEKELIMIRHPAAHKIQPTTTGGISTWILLNAPSTTTNFPLGEEERTKYPYASETQVVMKTTSSIKKVESNDQKPLVATIEKVTTTQPTVVFEKIDTQVPKKSTPMLIRKSTTAATQKPEKQSIKPEKQTPKPEKSTKQPEKSTQKPEKTTQSEQKVEKQTQTTKTTTPKTTTPRSTTPMSTTNIETRETDSTPNNTQKPVSTTRKVQPLTTRTTAKPKTTSQAPNSNKGSTTVKSLPTKVFKPNPQNKLKPTLQRKTTPKPEVEKIESPATPKIEKVTFRPVHMITTSQLEETNAPMFITKLKASLISENKGTTPLVTSTTVSTTKKTLAKSTPRPTPSKSNPIKKDPIEEPIKSKPTGNKANNVLKVQLKKPVNDLTKIEIVPIKVNAPVLKIEKLESEVKKDKVQDSKNEQDLLDNSKIDLKFDFNPELTRVDVETTSDKTPSSTTTTKTTSKRRQTNKRKKNKNRRRKPSTTASPPESTDSDALSTIAELLNLTDSNSTDNFIQESKIEPETKVANSTKNKKKQVQKPISTQIYNFLSREVMPSFGVMSLVGLGLGLASYFLYPFSGTIARRNYELEPNYKYNLDEYGGNYGQNEEEVFSKVLQGMTKHDNKFGGIKNYDNNYYKYQNFDGVYSTTTKKNEAKHSTLSGPIYRPLENSYDVNYRNSEFKYPDLPATPNYYERQKQSDFSIGKEVSGNRQFVVGSLPKEYSFDDKLPSLTAANKRLDYENTDEPTKFEREMAQNFNFPKNSVNIPQAYAQVESQTAKSEDFYEEIEITPTAVAVEHGPRLLRIRRSDSGKIKRESVIQLIPSKSEIEKEHREEEIPLSNEILDIIDSAIPGAQEVKKDKINEEDLKMLKKRQEEEKRTTIKGKYLQSESTTKHVGVVSSFAEHTTPSSSTTTSSKSSTTASSRTILPSKVSSKVDFSNTEATTSSSTTKGTIHPTLRNAEKNTEDWFNDLTTAKPKQPEVEGNNIFGVMRKIAEIKIKLALTLLKHASEGFARYLGHVQKRINGEE